MCCISFLPTFLFFFVFKVGSLSWLCAALLKLFLCCERCLRVFVRDDSASKASGCCVQVVCYVWTLKKNWERSLCFATNRAQGRFFSALEALAVSTNKDSIARTTQLSYQVAIAYVCVPDSGCHFNVMSRSKSRSNQEPTAGVKWHWVECCWLSTVEASL